MTIETQVIHPVLLCGGSGTRLWPLSRALYPKQLLQFESEEPLLVQTAKRLQGEGFAAPVVICNDEHRFLISTLLQHAGIGAVDIVLEMEGRNTAPAAAVAGLYLLSQTKEEADPLLLLVPSDHLIPDTAAFQSCILTSAAAARGGRIVTFGVRPTRAETGYGYIEVEHSGAKCAGPVDVRRFTEKPDQPTAEAFLRSGNYFWNSGIFLCSARTLVEEMERLAPDVLRAARGALAAAVADLNFLRLDAETYRTAPSISFDHAVMEGTDRASVLPVAFDWSDIGSWQELWERSPKDGNRNGSVGDVILEETSGCFAYSTEGRLTVLAGVEDSVVISTEDVVLVTKRVGGVPVKAVLERLATDGRSEHLSHATVYRPWGSYRTLACGPQFQVKELAVTAGAALSLQYHRHRAEHWVVVSGIAEVTRDEQTFELKENESTFIAPGQTHRLANRGPSQLKVIEVQCGSYLGEDDIVRLEDRYGRPSSQ